MTRTLPPFRRRLAALVLLGALVASGSAISAQEEPSDPGGEGTALKAQYDEVLGAEAELEASIDESTRKREQILLQIAEVNTRLAEADLRLTAAEADLALAERDELRAERRLEVARRRLEKARDELHAQAVAAYVHGGTTTPDFLSVMVASAADAAEASRTRSYGEAVVDHQKSVVVEFRQARAAVSEIVAAAAAATEKATAARDALAAIKAQLQRARVEAQALSDAAAAEYLLQQVALGELRGKKLEIEARIVSMEKDSDGIAEILAGIQLTQPDYTPGSLVFQTPLPGVEPGSPFGMRFHPILHYERLHAGIDFGAGSGTPIRAMADGTVVVASVRGGYGNAVVIDHGFGVASVYAHQSAMAVSPGQEVRRGDVIGSVGTTGLSTGPHLHLEMRLRGVPVNPTNFVDFLAPIPPLPADGGPDRPLETTTTRPGG